jgi:TolB-like protein/Tfp pilus assembly protein PilF
VVPFANLSGDASQEYFSDGITDDIITDLSRIPILFVIARSSSFTYKGKAERVEQIGRELGVKYLLEGSVRKLGDQVRINVQLVDATTGKEVWANRYDRQMRDIFKLQDEIVQGLITTLGLQLSLLEKGIILPQRTNNLEAYDYFLRAFEGASVFTREGFAHSRRMFEKAVALDPGYADAYASMGFLRWLEYLWQWDSDPRTLDLAEQLARKAASLDDSNASAYAVLGSVAALRNRPDEAVADGNRAIGLEPNNALWYYMLADILNMIGREPAQALSYAQKAMRLDPKHPGLYASAIGLAYLGMGRYREAVDALRVAEVAQPNDPGIHTSLCYAYTQLGRDQDAQAEAAEVTRAAPGFTVEMLKKSLPRNDWNTPGNRQFLDALRKAGLK